jgi:acyl carrier protein
MGLDSVEIVLRAEELFEIDIADDEAGSISTVGDFYEVICTKLGVTPSRNPVTPDELPVISQKEKGFLFLGRSTRLPAPAEVLPWSPRNVWDCLVAIFVDQQGLRPEEITYRARIAQDLGVD